MVVPAAGGAARRLRGVNVGNIDHRHIGWTHDGKALVFPMIDPETLRLSVYRLGLDSSPIHRLVKGSGEFITEPSISPDGRWLAYVADYWLRVQRLGSTGEIEGEPIDVLKEVGIYSPSWRPDGRQLIFLRSIARRIAAWSPTTRQVQTIYQAPYMLAGIAVDWSKPRAPRVVYAATAGQGQLRTLTLVEGGKKTAGPSEPFLLGAVSGAYSPDGRYVAFSRADGDGSQLWLADAEGRRVRQLTHLRGGMREPLWSRDGRHIAFHARTTPSTRRPGDVEQLSNGQIYVQDLDPAVELSKSDDASAARPLRQIIHTDFSVVSPQWSADGAYIYALRNDIGRLVRIPVNGGEFEDLFESAAARISPSGDRVYYGKVGQGKIFSRSLAGDVRSNPETPVLGNAVERAGFDVTANGLVYVGLSDRGERDAIRFFDFAERRSYVLAPPPSRYLFPTIRVSPDGSRVLYDTLLDDAGSLVLLHLRLAN